MELTIKYFSELTVDELYEIYKLRSDVFVVEQNCVYPDIDETDKQAVHIFLMDEGKLLSYCRLVPHYKTENNAKIGRVVSSIRHKGYASLVVEEALQIAKQFHSATLVEIDAQVYATLFYQKLGFKVVSEQFLEDNIPHVKMIIEL